MHVRVHAWESVKSIFEQIQNVKAVGLLLLFWVMMTDIEEGDGAYSSVRERCQKGSRSKFEEQPPDICDPYQYGEMYFSSKGFISVFKKRAKHFHLKVIYWICCRHSECFLLFIKRHIA